MEPRKSAQYLALHFICVFYMKACKTLTPLPCRQSTVGGVGPKIASTIGRMRNAAQLDGGAKSGKCEDVAEALSKMTVLSLGRSAIEDVSPIARVKNLEILLLAENNIRDLSPLLSMPNLIDVNVSRNRFKLTCPFADKTICTGIRE
jgi:Leucine-rich repeat (LRR) protein